MMMFWERGFETTSVNGLVSAMGINPPSLYGAFGSKEALFLEAIELYCRERGVAGVLPAKTERESLRLTLLALAKLHTSKGLPSGCMVIESLMSCSPAVPRLRKILAGILEQFEAELARCIERGKKAGELPANVQPEALATFFDTVTRGMSAKARAGAGRAELNKIVECAMSAWPPP